MGSLSRERLRCLPGWLGPQQLISEIWFLHSMKAPFSRTRTVRSTDATTGCHLQDAHDQWFVGTIRPRVFDSPSSQNAVRLSRQRGESEQTGKPSGCPVRLK